MGRARIGPLKSVPILRLFTDFFQRRRVSWNSPIQPAGSAGSRRSVEGDPGPGRHAAQVLDHRAGQGDAVAASDLLGCTLRIAEQERPGDARGWPAAPQGADDIVDLA